MLFILEIFPFRYFYIKVLWEKNTRYKNIYLVRKENGEKGNMYILRAIRM